MKKIILFLILLLPVLTFGQSVDGALKTVTAAGTDTYTFSEALPAAYDVKERWQVRFTNANTGAATLNRASLGAKAIKKNKTDALVSGDIKAGQTHLISYDGTNFECETCGINNAGVGTVTSVSGTTNRITSTGGATPVIDISASYVGQTSIVTVGTIGTGTWNATSIALGKGGTGSSLSDPGANKLWGWDDTDNAIKFFSMGGGLTYTHSDHTLYLGGELPAGFTDFTMTGSADLKEFAIHAGPDPGESAGAVYLYLQNFVGTPQFEIVSNSSGDDAINTRLGAIPGGMSIGLHSGSEVAQLEFNADTETVDFTDSRGTLKGIEYAATGYVTQTHTLADKEYSDGHLSGKMLPTAPGAGEDGKAIRWNNATPAWEYFSPSTTTSAALTKVDDTNVTLTLGGTPSTALLQATSITVGWTGDLAFSRLTQIAGKSILGVTGSSTADVAAITGTANQILRINGAGNAVAFGSIDLSQSAAVGTSIVGPVNGGSGIANNAASTITISGSFATTFTVTNTTGVTLPTTGTLATLAGSESLTNKKLGSLTTNGFVKVGSGDGTLSSGPDLTTTFSTANTITGTATNTLKLAFASLGTTVTDGAGTYYQNPTAAASGLQQISPILTLEGQGWKTTATAASQAVAFAMYTLPVQGSTNPTGTFNFASNVNGGGYVNRLQIDIANQVTTLLGPSSAGLFFGDNTLQLTRSLSGTQGLVLLGPSSSAIYSFAITGASSNNYNGTTGTAGSMQFVGNFVPSSGSQVFNYAAFTGTINMTSTSSGAVTLIKNTQTVTSAKGDYIFAIDNPSVTTISGTRYGYLTSAGSNNGLGTLTPTATLHAVGTIKLDGAVTLPTVGNKISIKEGSGGFMGQTALVLGTKVITVSGVTTSTKCFITRSVGSGGSLTVKYDCACTANTVTITAEVAADTINTSDVSTINYILFEPAP